MSEDVAKMILENIENKQESKSSIMESSFKEAAEKLLRVKDESGLEVDSDEDPELVALVKTLKEAEENGNLAYMTMRSWYAMEVTAQKLFEEHLNPLKWSGIYFRYQDYLEFYEMLSVYIEETCSVNIEHSKYHHKFNIERKI